MADTPQTPAPHTPHALARQTVEYLSDRLRRNQYRLKRHVRIRRSVQRDEAQIRQTIQQLHDRISREFDKDPALLREYQAEGWVGEE